MQDACLGILALGFIFGHANKCCRAKTRRYLSINFRAAQIHLVSKSAETLSLLVYKTYGQRERHRSNTALSYKYIWAPSPANAGAAIFQKNKRSCKKACSSQKQIESFKWHGSRRPVPAFAAHPTQTIASGTVELRERNMLILQQFQGRRKIFKNVCPA